MPHPTNLIGLVSTWGAGGGPRADPAHSKRIPESDVRLIAASHPWAMDITQLLIIFGAFLGIVLVALLAIVPAVLDLDLPAPDTH